MFTLSHTMPVNTEKPSLNQAQIWQGLLLKAENPVPFLDAMSACTVIDRGDNWLLRNFTLRGEEMQERVTFEPENCVTFERTRSSAMGTILNEIVTLDDGDMGLRFTFTLDVDGLADGSREEKRGEHTGRDPAAGGIRRDKYPIRKTIGIVSDRFQVWMSA